MTSLCLLLLLKLRQWKMATNAINTFKEEVLPLHCHLPRSIHHNMSVMTQQILYDSWCKRNKTYFEQAQKCCSKSKFGSVNEYAS
ncbi:hypothetical protein FKM82_006076 [Ascaphus truei]